MTKAFKVERKGKQTWVVVRQMAHDPQYKVGSLIPGLGKVVEEQSSTSAAVEAQRWNEAGADGVTADSIEQSRAKAAMMSWNDTEPCYRAETNAHITAFYQRHPIWLNNTRKAASLCE
jgi:hypothetical protein